jgi:hypothetical protein
MLWLLKSPVLLLGDQKIHRFHRWGVFAIGSKYRSLSEYSIRCLTGTCQHG